MTDNIVKFPGKKSNTPEPPKTRRVLLCSCGCQSFYFFAEGKIECCHCNMPHNLSSMFVEYIADVPTYENRDDSAAFQIRDFDETDETRLPRILRQIKEWIDADKAVFLSAFTDEGEAVHWFRASMKDYLHKLETVIETIRALK